MQTCQISARAGGKISRRREVAGWHGHEAEQREKKAQRAAAGQSRREEEARPRGYAGGGGASGLGEN